MSTFAMNPMASTTAPSPNFGTSLAMRRPPRITLDDRPVFFDITQQDRMHAVVKNEAERALLQQELPQRRFRFADHVVDAVAVEPALPLASALIDGQRILDEVVAVHVCPAVDEYALPGIEAINQIAAVVIRVEHP